MEINLHTTKRNFIEALFEVIVPKEEVRHNFIVRIYYYLIIYLKTTNKLWGAYYPIKKVILINLERFDKTVSENKLIKDICETITHEYLHYAIDICAGKHYKKVKYLEIKNIKSFENRIVDFMMFFDTMKNANPQRKPK